MRKISILCLGNIELSALEVVMGNVMRQRTDPEGLYRYDERKIRLHLIDCMPSLGR